jgi:hypothetical protein
MNPAFKAQVETLNTLVTEFNLQNLTSEPWQLMNSLKAIIGMSLQVFTTYENEQTDIWKDDKKFKAYNNMLAHIKVLKKIPVNDKSFDILVNSINEFKDLIIKNA